LVFSRVTTDSGVTETATGEKVKKAPEGGLYAARNGRFNQLTENPADQEPAFSRDGHTIVFIREGDLYTMRADGSGQRDLTAGPEVDSHPSLSPNGRFVLFERSAAGAGEQRDLYTIGVGGGNLHALTSTPDDDHEASFSPDGRAIIFVRTVTEAGGGTQDDLYSIRPGGTGLGRLTHTAQLDEFAPRYTVSGIAFSGGHSGSGSEAYADIFTMRRDGRKVQKLVAGAGSAYIEDVSPNGRLLLFRRDQGLWVKALPTGQAVASRARKLADVADGSTTNAVFSSTGQEIAAFIATKSATETEQTLTAISVATGRQRALAEGFSSLYGSVTTTIGPVIAWQPVPTRR
jgi:Tol biopolymer transport system component